MKRFNQFARFFYAYMKYLDQIRAMLTVPFIQSKSAFASFTVLEPPLIFNLAQRKPFVVILLYTDTIIKQYQIPI